ncbi:hypothetical protein [Lutibacter citreus]|uniref:hypothetical protein n=1 Tax=Lutibacter citreus TaxID=2138210 RepID=UPI001300A8A5|nr:hypothetical protein [Lutibacter citreus]
MKKITVILLCFISVLSMAQTRNINKTYLTDITEQYLEAMVRGKLEGLPLATNLKVTSNSKASKLGKGDTWKPGVRFVNRYTFVDPITRTSMFFGTVAGGWPEKEGKRVWWSYIVRLTVDKEGNIFEIEEQSSRGNNAAANLARPWKEAAIFAPVIPEDERVSTEELIRVSDTYFTALTTGEGTDVLFSSNMQRTEMGGYTVNQVQEEWPGSKFPRGTTSSGRYQFEKDKGFQWRVDNRRWYIVDEARGIAVAIVQFNKHGEKGRSGMTIIEAFKVVNGRIDFIWAPAFNHNLEDSGWSDWERPNK